MALIGLQEVTLALGGSLLFDGISLQIEAGERIALLGRNGTGKTTLMKVIAGMTTVPKGEISYAKGIKVAHLPQEVPADLTGSVYDIVLSGLPERMKLLGEFHRVHHKLESESSPQLLNQLDKLHEEMDRTDGWETQRQVEDVIEHLKLDSESLLEQLSGGQKRKVLLAKALVARPDVLLLDEPTNHLDIQSIGLLEEILKEFRGTILFVTHDRMFMTRLATTIVELDRGKLYSWKCDYPTFLERKKLAMHVEEMEWKKFDKKLAQEEVWIRQGIKARRTRNEGRVTALEELRRKKRAQRRVLGKVRMQAQEAERSGQLVTKAEGVSFAYGDKRIIENFSARIMRGDRIGVIGPNGCGKTTFLRILLGQLPPQSGKVTLGTQLEITYFDQLREQLDEEKTVAQNLCGEGDTVVVAGKPRNVMGYLQDFLFDPSRARTTVKVLSGGERNRLLLARLFLKASNLLIMDEPTNDLDIETLELLEELLIGYAGTLILVSHDRTFLNNVVTSTIVFEGDGKVYEHPGGYDDWLNRRGGEGKEDDEDEEVEEASQKESAAASISDPSPTKRVKLTFKEKKELEGLPTLIEKLEAEQAELLSQMSDPAFIRGESARISGMKERVAAIAAELATAYGRWESLDLERGRSAS